MVARTITLTACKVRSWSGIACVAGNIMQTETYTYNP